ncbi:MAG: hypothetical protein PHV16_01325 [Candidatus Nanoarchaeia archaeon]|nr:hypothetical protein [Candidatus Nanoarchaeia archaeon]
MRGKFAQVSMEYLIIVGFVLIITTPLIIIFYQHTATTNYQIITSQADKIVKKIVDNSEAVYYLGEPSKTRIKVYMPENVESIVMEDYEVCFKIKTKSGISDISQTSSVNISGDISTSPGIHYITIEAREGYVWVEG